MHVWVDVYVELHSIIVFTFTHLLLLIFQRNYTCMTTKTPPFVTLRARARSLCSLSLSLSRSLACFPSYYHDKFIFNPDLETTVQSIMGRDSARVWRLFFFTRSWRWPGRNPSGCPQRPQCRRTRGSNRTSRPSWPFPSRSAARASCSRGG